jgi:hypothetical protein
MKLALMINGGLRIEPESALDWNVLRCIVYDAAPDNLATRLASAIDDPSGDWREFVVPELETTFSRQLLQVREAIELCAGRSAENKGAIEIFPDQADLWYGALNQARLALEELHHFGGNEPPPPTDSAERRSGFFRSQFYFEIQQVLISRVMKP